MCLGLGWRLGLRDVGTERRWHDEKEHKEREGLRHAANSLKDLGDRRRGKEEAKGSKKSQRQPR